MGRMRPRFARWALPIAWLVVAGLLARVGIATSHGGLRVVQSPDGGLAYIELCTLKGIERVPLSVLPEGFPIFSLEDPDTETPPAYRACELCLALHGSPAIQPTLPLLPKPLETGRWDPVTLSYPSSRLRGYVPRIRAPPPVTA